VSRCKCPQQTQPDAGDGIVRIRREVRRGKPTTVVIGLPLAEPELRALAKDLKKKCGTGGSAKQGQIEIQGDQRDVLVRELEERGYKVKLAGG
jgi:translation initiation factor 1